MKWLANLDLNKNQLLNAVIQNLASAPGTPTQGQIYFNTTDKKIYLYNNTAWVDLSELNLTGAEVVTLINASASLIDDNNLSTIANDAITKRHSQNTDVSTTSATFALNGTGVKLKNNAGGLQVRNNADSAFTDVEGNHFIANGNLTAKGNTLLGDGGTDTIIANTLKTTIKAVGTKLDGDASTVNVFEITDSTGTPNKLFEVRKNGDTIIAGVLTVNGTGTSTFAGDVSIGGALNVALGTTATANMAGENLTLSGNLVVNGNTTLGDNAGVDVTNINGLTTIKSKTTKALGSAAVNAFKVSDSVGSELFSVKENGDTVIGGILTVNGTGTSTFAGDVNIGGSLTVADSATVQAQLAGNDLTLVGNLVVNGNTTLGDAGTDTITVAGAMTATGAVVLPAATTIGGVTQANISDAVTKKHTANTDTGTSSATFQVGTSGVKIKDNAGTELQIRNAADSAYANLRVANLIVDGTTTTINSNTVDIGDNEILLNSDITTNATNSDGGIAVKRLKVDNVTRADAKLNFNNSTNRWEAVLGVVATPITAIVANKLIFAIGNGALTSIPCVHNLGTRDVGVTVRETGSAYEQVLPDVVFTDLNTVTLNFAVAPTASQYTATIIG